MQNNQELMRELKIEERMSLGFKHKSIQRVHREYKKCNTLVKSNELACSGGCGGTESYVFGTPPGCAAGWLAGWLAGFLFG